MTKINPIRQQNTYVYILNSTITFHSLTLTTTKFTSSNIFIKLQFFPSSNHIIPNYVVIKVLLTTHNERILFFSLMHIICMLIITLWRTRKKSLINQRARYHKVNLSLFMLSHIVPMLWIVLYRIKAFRQVN